MDWYFRITSTNNNVQGYELEQLPIPAMSDDELKRLDSLAKRVMELKLLIQMQTPPIGKKRLMIWYTPLYGLTDDDEIAIVEDTAE